MRDTQRTSGDDKRVGSGAVCPFFPSFLSSFLLSSLPSFLPPFLYSFLLNICGTPTPYWVPWWMCYKAGTVCFQSPQLLQKIDARSQEADEPPGYCCSSRKLSKFPGGHIPELRVWNKLTTWRSWENDFTGCKDSDIGESVVLSRWSKLFGVLGT